MHHKIINTAILFSKDIPTSISKDSKFYDYLLDNGVAYYYSAYLSKEKSIVDKKIIVAGNILNDKYMRTLEVINKICIEENIKFLLFKSYKYFHEVVDNDIDLFVQKKDFHNFIKAFEKEGFTCIEDENLKWECSKKSFCKIEPRVNSSFRRRLFLNEDKIWEKAEPLNINGMKIFKTTKEIDLFHLLLSILYTPSYLKLYLFKLFKESNIKKLYKLNLDEEINQDIKYLLKNLVENAEEKCLPSFLGNINFTRWWFKRIFLSSDISLFKKFTLILFFFYSKYSYIYFNRLVFKHPWPLNLV